MIDFLFPLTLPFTAMWLGRSCPAQSSSVPGDFILIWRVKEKTTSCHKFYRYLRVYFDQDSLCIWRKNQECFLSEWLENHKVFYIWISTGPLFHFVVSACPCEWEHLGEEIQWDRAKKEALSWRWKNYQQWELCEISWTTWKAELTFPLGEFSQNYMTSWQT